MTALRTTTARLAAAAAATALLTGLPLLTATPAQAGGYCRVIPHAAPVHEHPDPSSRVVRQLDAGTVVAGSHGHPWEIVRVATEHDHAFLGYMKPYNLDCSL